MTVKLGDYSVEEIHTFGVFDTNDISLPPLEDNINTIDVLLLT